jgi:hypothetical protein
MSSPDQLPRLAAERLAGSPDQARWVDDAACDPVLRRSSVGSVGRTHRSPGSKVFGPMTGAPASYVAAGGLPPGVRRSSALI